MSPQDLIAFLKQHKLGVVATTASDGAAQGAVVGIATSPELEIVFDTLTSTRKYQNLRRDPRAALVVGWDECTAQLDCIVDEPRGDELERLKAVYYEAYPDGPARLAWPGLCYIRLRPTWARFSDYRTRPELIVEFGARELGRT
jgi:hypothetical protein